MSTELPGYRPVSGLAVAAVAAGAVAALAVASPFFWFLPLVGIGLACLGLADVRRPGAEKAGRAAALVGLALSVGFGAQALSAAAAARYIAASRAVAATRFWLDALREGREGDATSVSLPEAMAAAGILAATMSSPDAACGLTVRSAGSSAVVPHGIVVEATISCRGPVGQRTMRVHVVPETTTHQGRPVERWMVARCD